MYHLRSALCPTHFSISLPRWIVSLSLITQEITNENFAFIVLRNLYRIVCSACLEIHIVFPILSLVIFPVLVCPSEDNISRCICHLAFLFFNTPVVPVDVRLFYYGKCFNLFSQMSLEWMESSKMKTEILAFWYNSVFFLLKQLFWPCKNKMSRAIFCWYTDCPKNIVWCVQLELPVVCGCEVWNAARRQLTYYTEHVTGIPISLPKLIHHCY